MAWSYQDYESQSTNAARLTRLRLHIGEVSAYIGVDMSSAAGSVSHGGLTQYLQMLSKRRAELEQLTGAYDSDSPAATGTMVRIRPVR